MFLIKLNKLFFDKVETNNVYEEKPCYINPHYIASMMVTSRGTSIAIRGFDYNTIVTETPEEIMDAVEQAKMDEATTFWREALPAIEVAIVDGSIFEPVIDRFLRPAVVARSGTVPDAENVRGK